MRESTPQTRWKSKNITSFISADIFVGLAEECHQSSTYPGIDCSTWDEEMFADSAFMGKNKRFGFFLINCKDCNYVAFEEKHVLISVLEAKLMKYELQIAPLLPNQTNKLGWFINSVLQNLQSLIFEPSNYMCIKNVYYNQFKIKIFVDINDLCLSRISQPANSKIFYSVWYGLLCIVRIYLETNGF